MCWDDSLIAIGTEVGSIELYSVKKILQRAEQASRERANAGGAAGATELEGRGQQQVVVSSSGHGAAAQATKSSSQGHLGQPLAASQSQHSA